MGVAKKKTVFWKQMHSKNAVQYPMKSLVCVSVDRTKISISTDRTREGAMTQGE